MLGISVFDFCSASRFSAFLASAGTFLLMIQYETYRVFRYREKGQKYKSQPELDYGWHLTLSHAAKDYKTRRFYAGKRTNSAPSKWHRTRQNRPLHIQASPL